MRDVPTGLDQLLPLVNLAKLGLGRGSGTATQLEAPFDRLADTRAEPNFELPVDPVELALFLAKRGHHTLLL